MSIHIYSPPGTVFHGTGYLRDHLLLLFSFVAIIGVRTLGLATVFGLLHQTLESS